MTATDKPVSAEPEQWTVKRILDWTTDHLRAHGSETPRLDAEILLAHARGCQRIELYTRYAEVLSDAERGAMRDLVKRRAKAEPVAYLVGRREFFSLNFRVTPDVLIPRPDTETLVVELLKHTRNNPRPRLLDVGTGSGCVAIASAAQQTTLDVTAIDISEPALEVARANAALHNVQARVRLLWGDLFAPLESNEQFDVIASNPPYLRDDELDAVQDDIRLHEPKTALLAGPDGLAVLKRLIAQAPSHLVPGGWLLIEIAPEQVEAVKQLFAATGKFGEVEVARDLSGQSRVVAAQLRSG